MAIKDFGHLIHLKNVLNSSGKNTSRKAFKNFAS